MNAELSVRSAGLTATLSRGVHAWRDGSETVEWYVDVDGFEVRYAWGEGLCEDHVELIPAIDAAIAAIEEQEEPRRARVILPPAFETDAVRVAPAEISHALATCGIETVRPARGAA